jgi:hypothetical protein
MDGQTANPLQSGGEAITLNQALGSLLNPTQDEKPAAPVQEQQPPEQAQQAEPAAEEAQPERETTETETEDQELPPLKAPSFWQKPARDVFNALPRHAQEAFLEQERVRNEGVERQLREAAEKRKSADSELTAAQNERQRYQQQLSTFVPLLQQQLQGKWAGMTEAKWIELARLQPAEYTALKAEFDADMGRLYQAQSEAQRMAAQQQQEQARAAQATAQREAEALIAKRPELKDPAKQAAWTRDLRDYALEAGFTEDYLSQPKSHMALLTLEKAMLYDRAQTAKATAMVRSVPKVQTPGTAKTKADQSADARAAMLKKLEQTGSIEDARGLLRR